MRPASQIIIASALLLLPGCRADVRPANPQLGGHHLGETWTSADHTMPCSVDTLRTMDSRHGTVQRVCSADGEVMFLFINDTIMAIKQVKEDSGAHDLRARWEAYRPEAIAMLGSPDSVPIKSIGSHKFIKAFWHQPASGWEASVVIDEDAPQVGTFLTSLAWLQDQSK